MHILCKMLLIKTGIKYFNVETWIFLAALPPYQNFWLRAC